MNKSPLRTFAAGCIVFAGFCFVTCILVAGLRDNDATQRDFIEYWAAGQQMAHGANPYDIVAVLRVERSVGFYGNNPLVSLSPPVALYAALPLGWVGTKTGLILWEQALLICLSLSIWLLWRLHGRPARRFHLLGYFFAPTLVCLMAGQICIFMLLGIVLFLNFHHSRPFLAGAALLPCALKPHLFLPLAVGLLLWVVSRKAYGILAGFSASLLVSCALSLYCDRLAWSQYLQMARLTRFTDVFIPTWSVVLRFLIDRQALWLQYLPAAAGCAWTIWFFLSRRARWNWMEHGMLLLIVSVACAPYGYVTDETLLFPAVLAGLYKAEESRRSLLPFGLIAAAAMIEAVAGVRIISPFYLWTVPAWLGWYLYATGERKPARIAETGAHVAE